MPLQTNLFFNVSTRRFVLSPSSPVDQAQPEWVFGDTKNLQIQFVRNQDINGQVSIVPASEIGGLQVALGPRGTAWTSATSPGAVNDVYAVSLPLTGSGLSTALASATSVDTFLELKTTSGGLYDRYQTPIRINQRIATDTLPDPAPTDPAIGRSDALNTFVSKDGAAGDYFVMRSSVASGSVAMKIYIADDLTLRASPLN